MSREAYCPTPLHAVAKFRIEGVFDAYGDTAFRPLVMIEEEDGLSGIGRFEALGREGARDGIYLEGTQSIFHFPLYVQVLPEPEPPKGNPVGLRIAKEGTWSIPVREGRRRVDWMEVEPVFPPL